MYRQANCAPHYPLEMMKKIDFLVNTIIVLSCSPLRGVQGACDGTPTNYLIDFETDAAGNPLSAGDTPLRLPGGVRVRGNRRGSDDSSRNDLVIFDSSSPTGGDTDLFSETERNILIINENDDKSNPDDNRKGGHIFFNFRLPVQVNQVRFLDLDSVRRRPTRLIGTTTSGEQLRTSVPRPNNDIQLNNWTDIRRLRVNLFESGAIASLNITVCSPGCEKGQVLTKNGMRCIDAKWVKIGRTIQNPVSSSVKISDDGQTLVVGAASAGDSVPTNARGIETTGRVRVFQRNEGFQGLWQPKGQLIVGNDQLGEVGQGYVDLSSDGNKLLVSGLSLTNSTYNRYDVATVYSFSSSTLQWTPIGPSFVGPGVEMSSDGSLVVVVGCSFEVIRRPSPFPPGFSESRFCSFGVVDVFVLTGDDSWSNIGSFTTTSEATVAVAADGSAFTVAETTSSIFTPDRTRVYVLNEDRTNFDPIGQPVFFGQSQEINSVTMSRNGRIFARIGVSSVAAYEYIEEDRLWVNLGQVLVGFEGNTKSVSLSEDGKTMAVLSSGEAAETSSSVSVYCLINDQWVQIGGGSVSPTLDNEPFAADTVSLSGDGSVFAVGGSGPVQVYELRPAP